MSQPVRGRCLCGACTFSVTLRDENVDACHCGQCRTWAAGPFMDVMALSAPVFDDQDAVGVYRSSEWGERLFCKTCGSALAWRFADDHDKIAISAFAVPLSDAATFRSEVFIDAKPRFYDFAQDTKKMTGEELMAAMAPQGNA